MEGYVRGNVLPETLSNECSGIAVHSNRVPRNLELRHCRPESHNPIGWTDFPVADPGDE